MQAWPSTRDSRTSSADLQAAAIDRPTKDNGRSLRTTRSDVWFYFKPKYINAEGVTVAECRLCSRPLSACNTTNLKSHLTTVHRDDYVFDRIKDRKVLFVSVLG